MVSGKSRLYVVLLRHPGAIYRTVEPELDREEDEYSWALLTGPKPDRNRFTLYRLKLRAATTTEDATSFLHIDTAASHEELGTWSPVVRILVAKVEQDEKLDAIIRNAKIIKHKDAWSQVPSVYWARQVLNDLQYDKEETVPSSHAVGTSCLRWETVRDQAMAYVSKKGVDNAKNLDNSMKKIPTFDLLEMKETIS